jgi:hypothetical protein
MTQPAARVAWQGQIAGATYRVIDLGAGLTPRVMVEIQAPADAMGGHGWQRFEPIPRDIFEAMLIAAGVIH